MRWVLAFNYGNVFSLKKEKQTSFITSINNEGYINIRVYFNVSEQPITLTGYGKESDSVHVLYTVNRIGLYINNILWDEDWPAGITPVAECIMPDFVSINDADEYINNLPVPEYKNIDNITGWRPEGINTMAGDCMPFAHDDKYHLFYLFDRRRHQSKWSFGAHQWAHLSTYDLRIWHTHPMAVTIDHCYEGSICTGSLIYYNGRYYAFYAIRMFDRSPARLAWSVSDDGNNFVKKYTYITLKEPYHTSSARDPMVFYGDDGFFHMLVTTSYIKNGVSRGALAHLISDNLENWTQQSEPMLLLNTEDQPECPDYFKLGDWYYLIIANYGRSRYLKSKYPLGPWTEPENNFIGHTNYRVPKSAFYNGRVIFSGFVPETPGYAGTIELLEATQNEDGTLSFITPKETE